MGPVQMLDLQFIKNIYLDLQKKVERFHFNSFIMIGQKNDHKIESLSQKKKKKTRVRENVKKKSLYDVRINHFFRYFIPPSPKF